MRSGLTILLLILFGWGESFGQDVAGAVTFHIYSPHTSFPDTGRSNGHVYDSVLYTTAEHYRDSSVLIVAPGNLHARKSVDLVFWFHGWRSNVDSASVKYLLTRQFIASKRNGVLVLAETARNAPDSYGGKLETPGEFKALVADVIGGLKAKRIIGKKCKPGHILLGGHSGAYRVMARIIKNGQMPVDGVMLFDALYGETDIFMDWIRENEAHRFTNLYTDHGGTRDETRMMMKWLDSEKIPYFQVEETALVPADYKDHPLIFIHSLKPHDAIVSPDNFRLMLENEPFLNKL